MKFYNTDDPSFDGKLFLAEDKKRPNMAIFLSGSGSNAEKLLNDQAVRSAAEAVVLITDAPEKSRAGIIGSQYNIPVIEIFSVNKNFVGGTIKCLKH